MKIWTNISISNRKFADVSVVVKAFVAVPKNLRKDL